ncbi:MAG: DUF1559 domain-containing protein [Thermoguttaceae bacterium]|nr:DUF1559 domain-containing protein [Thermoguttaceae bacterium]MDW8037322.1 DUF1559 domain-containing protein [Thermoguttaceae bacterium]
MQAAREAARRAQCANNFRQATLAVHNYHAAHQCFPPGLIANWRTYYWGWSWSVYILPYLEQASLYGTINFKSQYWLTGGCEAGAMSIPVYNCPSDPRAGSWGEFCSNFQQGSTPVEDFRVTNLTGVADSDVWGRAEAQATNRNGMFFANYAVRISDVRDGTSNTLCIGEITGAPGRHPTDGPGWFQPTWYTFNCQQTGLGINGPGTVPGGRPASDPVDGDGGNRHDEMFGEIGFSSFHPGGCHFSLADGSARFFSENIDYQLLRAITTRDGGEVVRQSDF